MQEFYVPHIITALNRKLPNGYWAKLEEAKDESVDAEIIVWNESEWFMKTQAVLWRHEDQVVKCQSNCGEEMEIRTPVVR